MSFSRALPISTSLLLVAMSLAAGGCHSHKPDQRPQAQASSPTSSSQPPGPGWKSYVDPSAGYRLQYPSSLAVDTHAAVVGLGVISRGTVFHLPTPQNEQLAKLVTAPRIDVVAGKDACPRFGPQFRKIKSVELGPNTFEEGRWSEGTAGTLHVGTTLSTRHNGRCYRLTFYRETHQAVAGADDKHRRALADWSSHMEELMGKMAATLRFVGS